MLVRDSNNKNELPLINGPRNKSLATRHLEYIIYALLDENSKVFSKKIDNELIILANTHQFNLTEILKAKPDFEQFYFSQQQLDYFTEHYHSALPSCFNFFWSSNNPMDLHPAEKSTLILWKSQHFEKMQALLHNQPSNTQWIYTLLNVCIATHGLSKPLTHIDFCKNKATRGESTEQAQKRHCLPGKTKLYKEKSFTATSTARINLFCLFRPVTVTFFQDKSINPIGKPISHFFCFDFEREVLYPPNTEFIYTNESEEKRKKQQWTAIPVRTINIEKKYNPTMSVNEINQINQEKIILLLKSVFQPLNKKAKQSLSLINQLFFLSLTHDEFACYRKASMTVKKLIILGKSKDTEFLLRQEDFEKAITSIECIIEEARLHKKTEIYKLLFKTIDSLNEIKRELPPTMEYCSYHTHTL